MNRILSIGVLAVALVALVVGIRFAHGGGGGTDTGCAGVREAYTRADTIEHDKAVPTSKVYADASLAVRKVAIGAPPAVAVPLNRVADAFGQLDSLLRGFDPANPLTYHVAEDHSGQVESQQAAVEAAMPDVKAWLDNRCH